MAEIPDMNSINDVLKKMQKTLGAEDEHLAPGIMGVMMMEIAKLPEKEQKELAQNIKNPAFDAGVQLGASIVTAVMEYMMNQLEREEKIRNR